VFSLNQRVILCVDDEPNILMLRQILLSIAGYNVLTADNGEDALEIVAGNHVDLVITDQLLPGLSGTDIAAEMKRINPALPIVLFTGLPDPPTGAEHIDLVLTKGMTPPEFLNAIGRLAAPRSPARG
jgi:CheY-like chemotaxis protein